jgi:hypothetical protein
MRFLLFIIILIVFLFTADRAYIHAMTNCQDGNIVECFYTMFEQQDDPVISEGSITATGAISREFNGTNYSVSVSLIIPPTGGEVTGTFSGDCEGKITGNFAGGEGGVITGKGNGSCSFFLPASGNFSGTVNQTEKTVLLTGSASITGISGTGSITLTY